ncbi:MAG: hypothetical protein N2316_00445 [Spirochaetes bacterium]|nr:hypothetical protein [Spirochaetota bacterium]
MKRYSTCIFLFLAIVLRASNINLKEFVADAESVKNAVQIARSVHFIEIKLAPKFERREEEFVFSSQKNNVKVTFKSKRLALLCDKISSVKIFSDFIGRATVFGIQKTKDLVEGRMLVSSFCSNEQCYDEEFAYFIADN